MTAQLSRERLEEIKEFGLGRLIKPISDDEILALVDIALSGMDSKPVAESVTCWSCKKVVEISAIGDCDGYCPNCNSPIDLDDEPYITTPPAPVAVPDFARLDSLAGEFLNNAMSHNAKVRDAYTWCAHRLAETVRDCRAAMLKAGPVTGWIKCSERMPDETQPVITVAEGGVVQRTVYQFCDGVWVDWYEQYDEVKVDAFTHWMPLPAAPEQEV